jgi:hypothetical protein
MNVDRNDIKNAFLFLYNACILQVLRFSGVNVRTWLRCADISESFSLLFSLFWDVTLIDQTTMMSRNVWHQSPIESALSPGRTETSSTPLQFSKNVFSLFSDHS